MKKILQINLIFCNRAKKIQLIGWQAHQFLRYKLGRGVELKTNFAVLVILEKDLILTAGFI